MLHNKHSLDLVIMIIFLSTAVVNNNYWPSVAVFMILSIRASIREYQMSKSSEVLQNEIEQLKTQVDSIKLDLNTIKIDKSIRTLR